MKARGKLLHWFLASHPYRVVVRDGKAPASTADIRKVTCQRCREILRDILRDGGTPEQIAAIDAWAKPLAAWEEIGKRWLAEQRERRRRGALPPSPVDELDPRPPLTLERMIAIHAYARERLARTFHRVSCHGVSCETRRCDHAQCAMERIWQRGVFLMEMALLATNAVRTACAEHFSWMEEPPPVLPRRRHWSTGWAAVARSVSSFDNLVDARAVDGGDESAVGREPQPQPVPPARQRDQHGRRRR